MYNIISWYNQNRSKIWTIIIAVIIIGLILWRLIYMWGNNGSRTNTNLSQTDIENLNSITLSSKKSAVTGQNASISKEKVTAIDMFISYCNSSNLQEAYNLISDECKEEMFSDINKFKEIYYAPIFGNGKRNVNIENWYSDIYKIDYNEDFLSTGRYTSDNNIRDYITVVTDSKNNYKLNINKYIGRTEINKTVNSNNLQIKILRKDAYMDYEKYLFEVKNEASHEVLLGNIEEEESVSYLVDKNDIKYNAAVNELAEIDLTLYRGQTKNIQIKYFNQYSSTRSIRRLVFPKIYLNYQAYKGYQNKNNYTEYGDIQINF